MDEMHQYWYNDEMVAGTNEILKSLGLVNTDFYTEAGADRGKRRHELIERYDDKSLEWEAVADEDYNILIGYREFLEDTGFVVEANELPLFHPLYFYAGTLDKVGLMGERKTVIDIKTGSSVGPWAKIQIAMYSLAYAASFDEPYPAMGILHLRQAKKKQYSYKPVGVEYLDSARSIIETYHWQQGNRSVIEAMQKESVAWLDDMVEELEEVV